MATIRLPVPGEDQGKWGDILNGFLLVEHNVNGTLKVRELIAEKADDESVVHLSGAEAIGGPKTFTASPTVPTPTQNFHAANKSYVDSVAGSMPELAEVATSGSYDDLTDKPAIPDVSSLVENNDPRLSDQRVPTDNSVNGAKLQDDSITESKLAASNGPADGQFLGWNGGALAWRAQSTAPVSSVSGKTGAVTLDKTDVGLSNVDNTNDEDKPVSSAAQTALNSKLSVNATAYTVYGVNASGTQTNMPYTSSASASSLMFRTAGGVTSVGTPTAGTHATTKDYVDGKVAETQNLVIGTAEPTPPAGQQVLWLDTTGGNMTLNLVTGE